MAGGSNVGSPLAVVDVGSRFRWTKIGLKMESVVGPTSCYLVDVGRWSHGFAKVRPPSTFATGEATLRPPYNMT